jgi:UDP-glucose 4-epimerase
LRLASGFALPSTPSFSGRARPGDPPGYQADTRRAEQWGWRPRIRWTKGLQEYLDWFKAATG